MSDDFIPQDEDLLSIFMSPDEAKSIIDLLPPETSLYSITFNYSYKATHSTGSGSKYTTVTRSSSAIKLRLEHMPDKNKIPRSIRQKIELELLRTHSDGNYPIHDIQVNVTDVFEVKPVKKTQLRRQKMRFTKIHYDNSGLDNPASRKQRGKCVIDTLVRYKDRNGLSFTEEGVTQWFVEQFGDEIHSGIDCVQLEEFCKEHAISMYCADLQYETIVKYVAENSKNKALIFVIANNHIYEAIDEKIRKAIIANANNSDICSNFKKAKPKETKKEKDTREIKKMPEIPCYNGEIEEIDQEFVDALEALENNTIYYNSQVKHDLFQIFMYIFMEDGAVSQHKENARNMIEVYWAKKNITFYYNENIEDAVKLCELLQIRFENQSVAKLSRMILSIIGVDIRGAHSTFNHQLREVFNSDLMRAGGFVHTFENLDQKQIDELKSKKRLISYDYAKCYSHIVQTYDMPIFDQNSCVDKFRSKDEIQPGFLYVETSQFFPLRGNGWYSHYLVEYCLNERLISRDDIKYQIIATFTTDELKPMVEKIYQKYGSSVSKIVVNCIVGSIGMKDKVIGSSLYVDNEIEASYYTMVNNTNVASFNINRNNLYKINQVKDLMFLDTGRPVFLTITQIGNMLLHQLYTKITKEIPTASVLQVKVDAIHVKLPAKHVAVLKAKTKKQADIGDIRKEEPLSKPITKSKPVIRTEKYELKKLEWKTETIGEFNRQTIGKKLVEKFPNGCCVFGDAGTGKSVVLRSTYDYLSSLDNGKVARIAFTNAAAAKIQGQTFHAFFGIDEGDEEGDINAIWMSRLLKKYKYILVDEISMVGLALYKYLSILALRGVIIYVFGDFKQHGPVKEEHIDFSDSHVLYDLVNGNKFQLTHNYRADQSFADMCAKGEYSFNDFVRCQDQTGIDKFNICRWNKTRARINRLAAEIYGKLGEVGSYMITRKKIELDGKKLYRNTLMEVVKREEDENVVKLLDTKIEYTFSDSDFEELLASSELGYCVTSYKVQGMTIEEQYTIHDWGTMHERAKYTAMTRTTNINNVRVAGVVKGYIYKMSDNKDFYIGSTSSSLKKRLAEHKEAAKKNSSHKLYERMMENPEKWKIKEIDHLYYYNKSELFELEQYYIDKYQAIKLGLNSIQCYKYNERREV